MTDFNHLYFRSSVDETGVHTGAEENGGVTIKWVDMILAMKLVYEQAKELAKENDFPEHTLESLREAVLSVNTVALRSGFGRKDNGQR